MHVLWVSMCTGEFLFLRRIKVAKIREYYVCIVSLTGESLFLQRNNVAKTEYILLAILPKQGYAWCTILWIDR